MFDMGKSVKIMDLAEKMIRLNGMIPNQDIRIEITGLRPGEKLYEELLADEETTLPTHHTKILIAKTRANEPSFQDLLEHLLDPKSRLVEKVAIMKKMVPEFVSNNSLYEQLDRN